MGRQSDAKNILIATTKIQSLVRGFQARKQCTVLAQSVIEKIFDSANQKYYYFNLRYQTSRWSIPLFLKICSGDIYNESSAYLIDDAVIFIQAVWRAILCRKQIGRINPKKSYFVILKIIKTGYLESSTVIFANDQKVKA